MNSLDASGSLLAQELPLPNLLHPLSNGNNWVTSPTSPINWNQWNGRLDYNISHTQQLMFRYTQDSWTNNAPNLYQNLWGDDPWPALESNWSQPSKQIVGRLTSTIGTTWVNDLEFAYSANRINLTPGGTNPALLAQTTAGIPPLWPLAFKTFPVGIPTIWGGLGNYGSGNNLWMIAPWNNSLDIYTVRDDVSKVMGAHTIRFGAFFGWDGKNEMNGANSTQYPTFGTADWATNNPTGNNLANVLVPGAKWSLSEPSVNLNNHIRWRDYETYVADNWKLKRNLTVDVGLRWSVLMPPFSPNNAAGNFVASLYKPSLGNNGCNGVIVPPGTNYCQQANSVYGTNFVPGIPASNKYLQDVKYGNVAPRIGVSWDPTGSGNNAIRGGFGMFYQRDRTSATGYAITNNVPFVLNANETRTLAGPNPPGLPTGNASPTGGIVTNGQIPYSFQWNAAIEHGFAKNTTLEIAYVGNRAVHILNSYDTNYVAPQNWVITSFLNSNNGLNNYRPYGPGSWGSLAEWEHNGYAKYNALQALFKTQISKFQLQAAYTYSHSAGDVILSDSSGGLGFQSYMWGPNPALNYGNSQINRPQVFVANLVYHLPDLKGQKEMVQQVGGGWELGAITQYASGTSVNFNQNGLSENTAQAVDATHPTGGANSGLSSLFGVGYTNPQRPLKTNVACGTNSGSQVLNPNSVTLVGYAIGTIPTNLEPVGYCHGPGYVNTDFSVDKNWKIGERFRLQFRFDFFNMFNHPNFRGDQINGINGGSIAQNVNCGPSIGANASGALYNMCSPSNNVISAYTPTSGLGQSTQQRQVRELQYGMKLIF
jgi:hypothetical protein